LFGELGDLHPATFVDFDEFSYFEFFFGREVGEGDSGLGDQARGAGSVFERGFGRVLALQEAFLVFSAHVLNNITRQYPEQYDSVWVASIGLK
jgi:hypothetical protein